MCGNGAAAYLPPMARKASYAAQLAALIAGFEGSSINTPNAMRDALKALADDVNDLAEGLGEAAEIIIEEFNETPQTDAMEDGADDLQAWAAALRNVAAGVDGTDPAWREAVLVVVGQAPELDLRP